LTDALVANPRGSLRKRDELAGLILELDKYTGKDGGTKSRLMSSYDSGPWKVNRREASQQAYIPHATLSILGTIQPKAPHQHTMTRINGQWRCTIEQDGRLFDRETGIEIILPSDTP